MSFSGYRYTGGHAAHTQSYLMPAVIDLLEKHGREKRLFELGYGNGANAQVLAEMGYAVTGVEPSAQGTSIAQGRGLDLHVGSSEDDLAARFGTFPIVLSLEVIEHVFSPRQFSVRVHDLLEPGGVAIISTPYHGYFKNLALAVSGRMDRHFTALKEGGHIKFFSRDTLGRLFKRVGMHEADFRRVARVPALAKSMIAVYQKPM